MSLASARKMRQVALSAAGSRKGHEGARVDPAYRDVSVKYAPEVHVPVQTHR